MGIGEKIILDNKIMNGLINEEAVSATRQKTMSVPLSQESLTR